MDDLRSATSGRVQAAARAARPRCRGRGTRRSTPTTTWASRSAATGAVDPRPSSRLMLDAAGVESIVDLDGGWGETAAPARSSAGRQPCPDASRSSRASTTPPGRRTRRSARPRRHACAMASRAGARGLKVWKTAGAAGAGPGRPPGRRRRPAPRSAVGGRGRAAACPVTIHVADPIAFFEPLDAANERWEELPRASGLAFLADPARPAARTAPGFPPFDELIDALEAVVVRHPATAFIGAHVGCAAEDLARVERILERVPELPRGHRGPDRRARPAAVHGARAFVVRWADRVLFGTDMAPDPALVRASTTGSSSPRDESFPYDADPDAPPSQGRWRDPRAATCPTTSFARSTARMPGGSSASTERGRRRAFSRACAPSRPLRSASGGPSRRSRTGSRVVAPSGGRSSTRSSTSKPFARSSRIQSP